MDGLGPKGLLSRLVLGACPKWARRPRRGAWNPTIEPLETRQLLSTLSASRAPEPPTIHASQATDSEGFVPMFGADNTAGWIVPYSSGHAVVKNGVVMMAGDRKFFLVSQANYKDFVLELDARIPTEGNSGIQFRSRYGRNWVQGYQADIDTGHRNWAGGLWYEGRGWIVRPPHRAPVHPGKWNHYRVEAIGDHIRILVNGVVTVDTHNSRDSDGHIALQDHGGPGVYQFRNVRIEDLGR